MENLHTVQLQISRDDNTCMPKFFPCFLPFTYLPSLTFTSMLTKIAKYIESKITPEHKLESLTSLHICQIPPLSLTLSQSTAKTLNTADYLISLP